MELDPERPVFVPGAEDAGATLWQAGGKTAPVPDEPEAAEETSLPISVMEELVGRLLTLPQELRDVVCWRFAGLEYPEIAKRQRITMAGAEARHRRAMRMFPELRQLFIAKTARTKLRHGM
jgi:DNA-directed RNA polymerase specialized sigma24 family protein